jgi:hypothetical protein
VGLTVPGDNDEVLRWIKGLLLNSIRSVMGQVLVEQQTSMLQLMAMQQTLALRFAQTAPDLAEIGCRILTVGEFQVNISDDDRNRLVAAQGEVAAAKRAARTAHIGIAQAAAEAQQRQFELDQRYQQDARYVQNLAGNFANYASGQALIGAGAGLAQGGGGDSAAGNAASLGVGFALANQLSRGLDQGAAPAAKPVLLSCPACKREVPAGKFCSECGSSLVPVKRLCSACGTEGAVGARFCAGCGTAFPAPG